MARVWKEGRYSTLLLPVDPLLESYEKDKDLSLELVELAPGARFGPSDRWVVLRQLGYGDTSSTWLCRDQRRVPVRKPSIDHQYALTASRKVAYSKSWRSNTLSHANAICHSQTAT